MNRDDLRTMLHGRWLGTFEQEQQVTAAQQAAITALLISGRDVICDDTNLHPAHLEALRSVGITAGAEVEMWDYTDVPLATCIERDAQRDGAARVGEDVIRGMWERHLKPVPPEVSE